MLTLILPYTRQNFKKIFGEDLYIMRKITNKLKKIKILAVSLVFSTLSYGNELEIENINPEKIFIENFMENIIPQDRGTAVDESQYMFLYDNFRLSDKINYRIFKMAMKGYAKIDQKKNYYLTIIDYSKPSSEKRFVVLNMSTLEPEDYTYVAHGKNSGAEMAVSFSNKLNSYKSSLGFYLTGKTYNGRYGYSLKLYGLEERFNSNAYTRGVVIHGAAASEPEHLKNYGFLGRTEGCPAIPKSLNKGIIEKLQNGSVVFIYGNDEKYLRESQFIK